MLANIAIGCGMMILTTLIHASAMFGTMRWLSFTHAERWFLRSHGTRVLVIAMIVLIMFIAGVIESAAWAVAYLLVGAMSEFEQAFYFSNVTYTTLGFGDVVIEGSWRLLSSFEAANGIIMFGWTTAVIVAAVQRAYFTHSPAREQRA
jgi:hypothetical protein